jgi:hypothetical protein
VLTNSRRLILAAAACLAVSGCNLVLKQASGNLPIEVLAKTAAAQTLSAGGGNALLTVNAQDTPESAAPTDTLTLMPPSLTPTATLTPTNEKVTVTVSRNTNCRTGPDKFFDLVGTMNVGETAEAVGRNAQKTYWVIKLPSNTDKTCWLWYEWATVNGNGDSLPIIASPPTPTWSPKPDFTFSYLGLTTCGSQQIIRLQVVNTGNVPWESHMVHVVDTVTSGDTSIASDVFSDYSGCTALAPILPSIGPGETGYSIGIAPACSSGHNLEVTLHLYTQNSGGGTHMSGNFNFAMP